MTYIEATPSTNLQRIVRLFWMYEDVSSRLSKFRIIADGCPGLIIQFAGTKVHDQIQIVGPRSFLYGQTTSPVNDIFLGPVRAFGVYFQPWAIPFLFGLDADELTNKQVDLGEISPALSIRIKNVESCEDCIEIVSSFIWERIGANLSENNSVLEIVNQIVHSRGVNKLANIYSSYHLSERTLVRRFIRQVGITPKHFSRIIRFQAVLKGVRQGNILNLAETAFACGYSDQAHLIRDFKALSGLTPIQFHNQCNEIIRNYPRII